MDIFNFLAAHSPGPMLSDLKTMVKDHLALGMPVSLELKLCARPYMKAEKFALHWTPLKDEYGVVQWVVLMLGTPPRGGGGR